MATAARLVYSKPFLCPRKPGERDQFKAPKPIIPVCATIPEVWTDPPFPAPSPTELAQGYIEFFEPGVFVEARPGLADQIGLARTDLDFGHPRIVPLDSYFRADGHFPFSMPFGTESFDIYKAMYDREFKFVARHEHRVALFKADENASPFIDAVFGGFPADGPMHPLSRAYVDAFDPFKLVPNAERAPQTEGPFPTSKRAGAETSHLSFKKHLHATFDLKRSMMPACPYNLRSTKKET
jgi:hypothetical protein